MVTEDYTSFEVAKLLKEKGFNEACHVYYDSGHRHILKFVQNGLWNNAGGVVANGGICAAPTLQMAMKWLREVHKIEIRVIYDNEELSWYGACNPMNEPFQILLGFGRKSKSYEEACESGIRYCLENLI